MNTRKAFLVVLAAGCGIGYVLAADQPLPWEREIPLREAAKSVALADKLNPTSPLPSGEYFGGAAMSINNLKMRTTLWGPPDRVTISINKNNVWDRRVAPRAFDAPTLQEVIDGANSPANKDYIGRARTEQRPKEYGYLRKEGGSYDAWRQPIEYPLIVAVFGCAGAMRGAGQYLKVDYPASTVEGELRIAVMEPALMLKPYMNNDGLSILFPVSLGRMQQTYSECFSNKNNTL